MSDDHWPAIRVERFFDESSEDYEVRRAEIVEIVQGFRRSRYSGSEADNMEARLVGLQEGLIAPAALVASPRMRTGSGAIHA